MLYNMWRGRNLLRRTHITTNHRSDTKFSTSSAHVKIYRICDV